MSRTRPNVRSDIGSVERVLFRWAESPESPRADEMGSHAKNLRMGISIPELSHFWPETGGVCSSANSSRENPFRRLGAIPGSQPI